MARYPDSPEWEGFGDGDLVAEEKSNSKDKPKGLKATEPATEQKPKSKRKQQDSNASGSLSNGFDVLGESEDEGCDGTYQIHFDPEPPNL